MSAIIEVNENPSAILITTSVVTIVDSSFRGKWGKNKARGKQKLNLQFIPPLVYERQVNQQCKNSGLSKNLYWH